MTLEALNACGPAAAREALARCLGARAWVERTLAARPFADAAALLAAAERAADTLERTDWLEAFSQHPRLGDPATLRSRFAATAGWSTAEQGGLAAADEGALAALAEANRLYEEKFGYIFILCATGLGPGEMLERLRGRLTHDPAAELAAAAAEQRKIARLRLAKLLEER